MENPLNCVFFFKLKHPLTIFFPLINLSGTRAEGQKNINDHTIDQFDV